MHATTLGRYGWHFTIRKQDGSTDHYTLEDLDRRFGLGVKGAAWEAGVLAAYVARLARAEVDASFNGVPIASAGPV